MNKKRKNCPLRALRAPDTTAAVCLEDRCAWFHMEYHQDGDYTDGKCALVRITDALRRLSNSQTFGNLEKETAAGAADTDDGKVEKV